MTEHVHGGHPPAEVDRINSWKIAAVGAASLALFVAASVVTVAGMRRQQAELNPAHPVMPAEAGQRKVGMVEQQLLENANRAETTRAQERQRLDSYGWVDRGQGLVHIPVERAVELVLKGERP